MPINMTGEYVVPADRETVWQALNEPEVLASCIPGCEEFAQLSDTEYGATVMTKVGPVKARFRGTVVLSEIDPPNGYRISGQGNGGVAGIAKGGADVKLHSTPEGETLLSYAVEAQVGGKLAQVGQRLVAGAAKKTADQFFDNMRQYLENQKTAAVGVESG